MPHKDFRTVDFDNFEFVVREHERNKTSLAYVSYDKGVVGLGADLDYISSFMRAKENVRDVYAHYNTPEELYINETETLINHEYLHLAIAKTGGKFATDQFDWIDNDHHISNNV